MQSEIDCSTKTACKYRSNNHYFVFKNFYPKLSKFLITKKILNSHTFYQNQLDTRKENLYTIIMCAKEILLFTQNNNLVFLT
ncbi:hypothetical protein CXF70_10455 [Planomicrobium sp. MB-3u-38]|nr:hypothetical protein CXF70_10455 [Planomicrobium sp. MB-3u-38]